MIKYTDTDNPKKDAIHINTHVGALEVAATTNPDVSIPDNQASGCSAVDRVPKGSVLSKESLNVSSDCIIFISIF